MHRHPEFKPFLALASICFFWGTTYVAIRIALESIPPLFLVSGRFLLSGFIMLAFSRFRGVYLPRGRELLWTAVNGVLILGIGNACLTYSERLIPSSLAALFIAGSPFWLAGVEAAVPGGEPLRWPTLAGMLVGFSGAALLVAPDLYQQGMHGGVWQGFLLLQAGSVSWSLGSILQKRHATKAHPFTSGAVQQFAAGLAFLIPAVMDGGRPAAWTAPGAAAFLYLVIFGSIVGYSSYIYALEKLPVALVSIYTYVNPVVAAVLGWLFYREPFGRREIAAMAVIFSGVAVVKRFTPRTSPSREP